MTVIAALSYVFPKYYQDTYFFNPNEYDANLGGLQYMLDYTDKFCSSLDIDFRQSIVDGVNNARKPWYNVEGTISSVDQLEEIWITSLDLYKQMPRKSPFEPQDYMCGLSDGDRRSLGDMYSQATILGWRPMMDADPSADRDPKDVDLQFLSSASDLMPYLDKLYFGIRGSIRQARKLYPAKDPDQRSAIDAMHEMKNRNKQYALSDAERELFDIVSNVNDHYGLYNSFQLGD